MLKTKARERDKAGKQMSMKMHNVRRMNENVRPTPIYSDKNKYGLLKNSYVGNERATHCVEMLIFAAILPEWEHRSNNSGQKKVSKQNKAIM